MNQTVAYALAAGVAVAVISGCSNGGTPAPSAAPAGPPSNAPAASQPAVSQSPTASPASEGAMDDPMGQQEMPGGQPFDYETTYADGAQSTKWKVTLTKVECGMKALPQVDTNPAWDGSTRIPEYIEAKPADGMQFCVAHWTWQNVGTKPDSTTHSGNIWIGKEQFAQSSEDSMRSWTLMKTAEKVNYSESVNPRSTTKTLDIYQIPAGEKPTAVSFPMDTIFSKSAFKVTVPA